MSAPPTPVSQVSMSWSGRLVVRILPSSIDPDYDATHKPRANVDPALLVPGTGPLRCTQHSPTTTSGTLLPYKHHIEDDKSTNARVRLDVYLFPRTSATLVPETPITLSLSRTGDELAGDCLKRLGINVTKKMNSHRSKKKAVTRYRKTTKGAASMQLPAVVNPFVHGRLLDTAGMRNHDFWKLSGLSLEFYFQVTDDEPEWTIPCLLECNPPTILSVSTFEKFHAYNYPGIPLVVEVETLFAEKIIADWYADGKLVCAGSLCYTPQSEDAGKYVDIFLKPLREDHDGSGCEEAYRFQRPVEDALPQNTVLQIRPDWQQDEKRNDDLLRILTYNVLADQNAFSGHLRQSFFPWVPSELLERSRRLPLILHEILAYRADVICLQEVDAIVYRTLLRPVLEHFGYQGFFSVKQTVGNQEGAAMFWSLDKFQRVDDHDFKEYGLSKLLDDYVSIRPTTPPEDMSTMGCFDSWTECIDTVASLLRMRPQLHDIIRTKLGHVVQMAHLRDHNGNALLVANTHLFFHPLGSHIRAMQLFAIAHQLTLEGTKPFILCGDFNTSLKNVAGLVLNKHLPKNFRDYRECLNSFQWDEDEVLDDAIENDDFPELRLPDNFSKLTSACPRIPEFTHYIVGFSASLDHILITNELRPVRQAEMPTAEQASKDVAMPGPNFPSDHVSVLADVSWTPSGQ